MTNLRELLKNAAVEYKFDVRSGECRCSPTGPRLDTLECGELVRALRAKGLFDEARYARARCIGQACVILAEYIVERFLAEGSPQRISNLPVVDLSPDEAALVLAVAFARGWDPRGSLCPPERFDVLASRLGLPVDSRDRPVVPRRPKATTRDILAGWNFPDVEGPFVDVYLIRNGPAQVQDFLDASLEQVVVVGEGIGATRDAVRDLSLAAALSVKGTEEKRSGFLILTDGLIGLSRDGVFDDQVQAVGGPDGLESCRGNALTFFVRELRGLAARSPFVRIHEVDCNARDAYRNRIHSILGIPIARAGLVSCREGDGPAGALLTPALRRGGRLRVSYDAPIPRALVTSPLVDAVLGPFETAILARVEEDLGRRLVFNENELVVDRERLAPYAQSVRTYRLAWLQANQQALPPVPDPDALVRFHNRLLQGDEFPERDVADVKKSSRAVHTGLKGRTLVMCGMALRDAANHIRRFHAEKHTVNCKVIARDDVKVAIRPRVIRGRKWYGTNLPGSISVALTRRSRLRELLAKVRACKRRTLLRSWSLALAIDLILRRRTLVVGNGREVPGFERLATALRPLLLLSYQRALAAAAPGAPPPSIASVTSPGTVFALLRGARGELRLGPWWFLEERTTALSAHPNEVFVRRHDLGEKERAAVQPTVSSTIGARLPESVPSGRTSGPSPILVEKLLCERVSRLNVANAAVAGLHQTARLVSLLKSVARSASSQSRDQEQWAFLPETPATSLLLTASCLMGRGWQGTNLDLARSWVILPSHPQGRVVPNSEALPRDPIMRRHVKACINLAEDECDPGFLAKFLKGGTARSGRFVALENVVHGDKGVSGVDAEHLRFQWHSARAHAALRLLFPLARLGEVVRTRLSNWDGVALVRNIILDLTMIQDGLGEALDFPIGSLLDELITAEHVVRR